MNDPTTGPTPGPAHHQLTDRHSQTGESGRLTPPPSFGAGGPVNGVQTDAVARWIAWHAAELAGVGVPVVLALAVSTWLVVLALPAAGLWAAQTARRKLPGSGKPALTSPDTTPGVIDEETRSE